MARFKGSVVGPNISDMTIQVRSTAGARGAATPTAMPVIRRPNFTDRTADVAIDTLRLLVGNERDEELRAVSLREYLGDPRVYLHDPRSWPGDVRSLLAERDSHVLVSAQACFLPVPREGVVEFNPVLFNYQARPGDPATLAIVATREGASATVLDRHVDDDVAWGLPLYFNRNGERCAFTGQRLAEFVEARNLREGRRPDRGADRARVRRWRLRRQPGRRGGDLAADRARGAEAGAARVVGKVLGALRTGHGARSHDGPPEAARDARRRLDTAEREGAARGHGARRCPRRAAGA
jgi:hypothetical protein